MKRRIVMLLIGASLVLSACGGGAKNDTTQTSSQPAVESVAQESVVSEESVQESVVPEADSVAEAGPDDLPDDNPLKGIADPAEMRVVYNEIDDLMNDAYLNGDLATETDGDKVRAAEDALISQVAEAHGLTYENVRDIYLYGGTGSLYNYDKDAIEIKHGKFVEAYINGTMLVVKAKIEPSLTNNLTIEQNYFNVADIIKNQHGDIFTEIQYWAVADMQSGDEGKVISFDVPKATIDAVKAENIADNQIGEYSDNLWILPSLLG